MKNKKLNLIFIILIFTFFLGKFINTYKVYYNSIPTTSTKEMTIHYIDVGQGDAALIQVNNKNLLIDSGPKSNRTNLINYLDSLNIYTIDYVIATHPHEDHIGNMAQIINKYNILNFYAPKIEHSTKTFEQMIEALKNKNLKIKILKEGTNSINLGNDININVLSPTRSEYENLNNYSPVIRLEFKNNSFLFTGDAEELVENDILNNNCILSSDVIKIGHHGSSTSTSEAFIKAVNPSIAIISVGADNTYGHPNKDILSLLYQNKIKVYRTDIDSTIVLTSDGEKIYKLNNSL